MGRQGEVLVSEALKRLVPAGYVVVDDIRWPGTSRGNVDHVVFGPCGMLVVDAKNWTGRVEVKHGILRQNGYRRERETEKVARMAADLQEHLGHSVGSVRSVLCLAGQPRQPAVRCGDTTVVGVDGIAQWLFRQPDLWPISHIQAVANWLPHVIESATSSATAPAPATEPRGRHQAD
jgi:hypothetical protein